MGKQHQIIESCELLDGNGYLVDPGYATTLHWRYDRKKIKAGWHRIKEWDYYYILCPDKGVGITFTMADMGYIGMAAVCWLDIKNQAFTQVDTLSLLPKGKMGFPPTSGEGRVAFEDRKIRLIYTVVGNKRRIEVAAPGFVGQNGEKGLTGDITLYQDPDMDTMVIATSWEENRRAFYYNQKINCMPAGGSVTIGDQTYDFTPETSFGGLDWGRGNWTYKNRWFWGSASGLINDESFGWNIGYGFSDRSPASENMIFYKGKAHKLDAVEFHFNENDYMAPWKITSNDNRFEMEFKPVIDRAGKADFILIKSIQHQVFGYFSGNVILDDNTHLAVDNFFGFAEDVLNWW